MLLSLRWKYYIVMPLANLVCLTPLQSFDVLQDETDATITVSNPMMNKERFMGRCFFTIKKRADWI
jgi:hypothetical protein